MSTTAYVARLKESRTFKTGVIEDLEEYMYQVRFGGIFRTLPPLPQANDERHVIVIEVKGNQPSVFSVLTRPNHAISPTARDVDKLVFIFFSVKPQRITIPAPQEGYLLGDGQRIFANIELTICITDVEQFWGSDRDPVANLESQVVNEAKKYFSKLNSASLINALDISQRKLEQKIVDSQLSMIMDGLQAEIRQKIPNGIRIDQVNASITLTQQLQDFYDRRRAELLNRGGIMDRNDVDTRIERDKTFAPHSLRALIMALDSRLLENFYSMPYGDAMRLVHETLARAKAAYLERRNNEEIERISKALDLAQRSGLSEMHIVTLQDKLAERLIGMVDSPNLSDSQSNQEYIRHLLSDKQPNQLSDSSGQRAALESSDGNQ